MHVLRSAPIRIASAIRVGAPTPLPIARTAKKPTGIYRTTFAMKSPRLGVSFQLLRSANAAGPRPPMGWRNSNGYREP
jgi:hypothetical protein